MSFGKIDWSILDCMLKRKNKLRMGIKPTKSLRIPTTPLDSIDRIVDAPMKEQLSTIGQTALASKSRSELIMFLNSQGTFIRIPESHLKEIRVFLFAHKHMLNHFSTEICDGMFKEL